MFRLDKMLTSSILSRKLRKGGCKYRSKYIYMHYSLPNTIGGRWILEEAQNVNLFYNRNYVYAYDFFWDMIEGTKNSFIDYVEHPYLLEGDIGKIFTDYRRDLITKPKFEAFLWSKCLFNSNNKKSHGKRYS